jgi:hypothetical protein
VHGSLCVKNSIVYVGNHAKTATVRTFDLDGHRLESGFTFVGPEGASVAGVAVDDDHRVWIADTVAGRVRAFTLVGAELEGLPAHEPDSVERSRGPTDVAATGVEDDQVLLVGCGGRGRHTTRVWRPGGDEVGPLRSLGDPKGTFHDVAGVCLQEHFAYVCEARARRVQVFRDGEFHFALEPPDARPTGGGRPPEPRAIAALPDGRMVLALAGEPSALLLLDAAGRLQRVIAEHGVGDGQVFHPSDISLEETGGATTVDRLTRLVAIDRDGERIQVFTLAGACYGAFDV